MPPDLEAPDSTRRVLAALLDEGLALEAEYSAAAEAAENPEAAAKEFAKPIAAWHKAIAAAVTDAATPLKDLDGRADHDSIQQRRFLLKRALA